MQRNTATTAEAAAPDLGRGWTRTLWIMVFVQFMMSASQTSASPILPLYLPELGVTAPSAVDFWSGVLSSVSFLIAAFASPIWGFIGDRHGRKLMVMRSSLANCLLLIGMGFSQHLWHLVALRALVGAFAGFSATAIALVATQAPGARLGFALGWLSTGQLVGALIGPIFGGVLADYFGSYRLVFFCTAVLPAAAVAVSWLGVTERFSRMPGTRRQSPLRGFVMLAQTPGLMPIFVILLVAQFGVRSVQPVVALFVQELAGPIPALATLAGFAFSITGLADLVASPFLGKRSDKIGYRRVLVISLAGAALATLPQALVDRYWEFLSLRFVLGMFVGGILPTANAMVGRLVAPNQRGLAYGVTASATFLGSFLGPFTGGVIAASFGIPWVFVVTGDLFLAILAWVFFMLPNDVPAFVEGMGAQEPAQGD